MEKPTFSSHLTVSQLTDPKGRITCLISPVIHSDNSSLAGPKAVGILEGCPYMRRRHSESYSHCTHLCEAEIASEEAGKQWPLSLFQASGNPAFSVENRILFQIL